MPVYTTDNMTIDEFKKHFVGKGGFRPPPTRFWEDERWMFEHMDELMQRYLGQWIVVYNRQVVAASKSRRQAKEQAAQVVPAGEPTLVFFLEDKPYVY